MKQVKVVADTTANLPSELVSELDIHLVPYCIQFGTETFYEGEGLSREEFHGRIAGGVFPKTSQPPIGRFIEVFQDAARDAAGIICVTLTSAHSGGYASAMAAREMISVPIEVVDSKAISMGSGFLAVAAARAARLGKSMSEIAAMIEGIRARVHHYIAVDTLKYLQLGGRVSSFQTALASMLSIKPILYVKDGVLLPYERVRTRVRSLERIVEATEIALGRTEPVRIAVLHDQAAEDCRRVLEELKARLNVCESFTGELSLALTSHSGPGMVGVISYNVGAGEP
jgi:DegV family protein with EDD domain